MRLKTLPMISNEEYTGCQILQQSYAHKPRKVKRSKGMRQRQIAEFIAAAEALPETVGDFQSDLWATLVDHVTVYGKKDVRFTMTNGVEIPV